MTGLITPADQRRPGTVARLVLSNHEHYPRKSFLSLVIIYAGITFSTLTSIRWCGDNRMNNPHQQEAPREGSQDGVLSPPTSAHGQAHISTWIVLCVITYARIYLRINLLRSLLTALHTCLQSSPSPSLRGQVKPRRLTTSSNICSDTGKSVTPA